VKLQDGSEYIHTGHAFLYMTFSSNHFVALLFSPQLSTPFLPWLYWNRM